MPIVLADSQSGTAEGEGSSVKRTPLARRTPLVARTPLRNRAPLRAAGGLLRRTPLAKVSQRRHAENQERWPIVTELRARQIAVCGFTFCQRCRRRGQVNGHELLSRAQGGSITDPANIRLVCDVCNGWFEDNPIPAAWDGWKNSGKHPRDPSLPPGWCRTVYGSVIGYTKSPS